MLDGCVPWPPASAARTTTYSELDAEAGRPAAGLADAGVSSGDRLAVLLPTTVTFLTVLFALQGLGAIGRPLTRVTPTGHLVAEGRAKEQIDRGGDKIAAAEVEQHLIAHPAVAGAAVVAMPDDLLEETREKLRSVDPHPRARTGPRHAPPAPPESRPRPRPGREPEET